MGDNLHEMSKLFSEKNKKYHNNPKYWDRYAFANSVDPDQMSQNAASDLGLHCVSYIEQYFRHIKS